MRTMLLLLLVVLAAGCGGGGGGEQPVPPVPVASWRAEGNAEDSAASNNGTLYGGVTYGPGEVGQAFVFNGVDGQVAIPDSPSLAITHSLTLDAWVWVQAYPSPSHFGAILLMRGDSRGGLDPYDLALLPDGRADFHICPASNLPADIYSPPIPLQQWTRLTGTLSDATGDMRLYVNGIQVAHTVTAVRPLGPLDPTANPSVSIGNQCGFPPRLYNDPFNGKIDEVRIYDQVVPPA